jgi:hypothetical protein
MQRDGIAMHEAINGALITLAKGITAQAKVHAPSGGEDDSL